MSLGFSQIDIAKRLSVSSTVVSGWERGERRPKASRIPGIATLLRIEPQRLAQLIHESTR